MIDSDVRVQVSLEQKRSAAQLAQVRLDPAVSLEVDRQARRQDHLAALFALDLQCVK